MSNSSGSAERVRAALAVFGHPETIIEVPATARTAKGAAEAVGCTVAQIAKSIVFRTEDEHQARPVLVITSGANRVDPAKVEAALGVRLAQADADWVREVTGFAIGGVAPIGHLTPPLTLVDEDLCKLDPDLGRGRRAKPRVPHQRGRAPAHERRKSGRGPSKSMLRLTPSRSPRRMPAP